MLPEDEVERVMAKKLKRAKKKARYVAHSRDHTVTSATAGTSLQIAQVGPDRYCKAFRDDLKE